MPLALAQRSSLIAPSATLMMGAEARRLKAKGVEVLDFALGEPDFDTPANIQQAAFKAISGGLTHYTPPAGHSRASPGDRGPLYPASRPHDRCRPGRRIERRQTFVAQCPDGRLRPG